MDVNREYTLEEKLAYYKNAKVKNDDIFTAEGMLWFGVNVPFHYELSLPQKFYVTATLRLYPDYIDSWSNVMAELIDDSALFEDKKFNNGLAFDCLQSICEIGDKAALQAFLDTFGKHLSFTNIEKNPIVAVAKLDVKTVSIDDNYNPAACVLELFKRYPDAYKDSNDVVKMCTDEVAHSGYSFVQSLRDEIIKSDAKTMFNVVTGKIPVLSQAMSKSQGAWFGKRADIASPISIIVGALHDTLKTIYQVTYTKDELLEQLSEKGRELQFEKFIQSFEMKQTSPSEGISNQPL